MEYFENVLGVIGNTPLVKINKVSADVPGLVLVKLETVNPGHSIKDRMALKMVEDAEKAGKIKPGGTFIECTSGNTGMGIAIAACVKGYKCIFTTSDKQSKEKFDMLKAMGSEVIVCPTNVTPDDPRSYYSVAERLSKEIPNSCWLNQYDNLSNRQAHYESTGPEIWKQTDGKVTHVVVGVGTGGTISGTAKYLKEQNPNIKMIGIDTYGSVFKKYHETGVFDEKEIYPYITEGIGEDILPKNVDFSLIDHFEKVGDKEGAVMARDLAREEGLLLGYSAGSAFAGLLQVKDQFDEDSVIVVIVHDHGSRYVGKVYNDDWMRERGFLDDELKVKDLIRSKSSKDFLTVQSDDEVKTVLEIMKSKNISQLPVEKDGSLVGSITETSVLSHLLENASNGKEGKVSDIMGEPFPIVKGDLACSQLSKFFSKDTPAVIAEDMAGAKHILTNYDIIQAV